MTHGMNDPTMITPPKPAKTYPTFDLSIAFLPRIDGRQ